MRTFRRSFFRSMALAMVAVVGLTASVAAQVGQKLIINRFVSDPSQIETHVVISDVDGVGPNVRISIFSEDGKLVYEKYQKISEFGKINYDPLKYVNAYQHGYGQNPKFVGTLRIESDGGNVLGQYWEVYKDKKAAFNTMAVPAAMGSGYDKLVCQHFVSDKNVNASLIIANAETERAVNVNINLFADQGGLIASTTASIPANGVVSIDPYKVTKGQQKTGTAYITVVGAGKITGEYRQAMNTDKEKYQVALPFEGVEKVR